MVDESPSSPPLAREILRYFVRHPEAADSLEGVATWRLIEDSVQKRVGETLEALEWLVSRRYLKLVSTAASGPIFCLDREHRSAAEAFLRDDAPGEPRATGPGARRGG